jgi:hypothetical protein
VSELLVSVELVQLIGVNLIVLIIQDLGMRELGLLSGEHVLVHIEICRLNGFAVYLLLLLPIVHADVDIDTVLFFIGLVGNGEEQVNIEIFSVGDTIFFMLSLGCAEATYNMGCVFL